MDVGKQIEYWKSSSDEDFAAAESLLEKGHLRHALFLAHLAVEKMLKAHVTGAIRDVPPRIHNLVRLAELAGLHMPDEYEEFLREFGMYQIEGRYPDSRQAQLTSGFASEEVARAKGILDWLKMQF